MAEPTDDMDRFAATLQAAYQQTGLHSPLGLDDVEERLRDKLELDGVRLTSDVLRALAFAIVNGRGL